MISYNQALKILTFTLPIFGIYYIKKRNRIMIKNYLKDKKIIITGASQGIGKNLSEELSKYDCEQFLLARSFKDETKDRINTYKCDCSDVFQVIKIINHIFKKYGSPDILVNCAGSGDWKYITEMHPIEITNCINAPLMSSVWTTREVLNNISDNELQIIFIQSPVSIQPWKSCTAYAISRWGMHGFAEALRMDYYNKKITVKEIIFGKVNTSYFTNNPNTITRLPLISKFIPTLSLQNTSDTIINSFINKKELIIEPFMIKLLYILHKFLPESIRLITGYSGFVNNIQ